MLVWDEEKKCYIGKVTVGSNGCSDIISIGLQKMEGNVSVKLLGLNPSFPNLEKSIRIIDCSTYKLTPSSLNVQEGGSVTITLETDAGAGDYNYTIYGSSITESDIQEGLTGKFVVNNSGIGVITLNISTDAIVENLETFTLELDNKKASVSINISDIYYSVSANPSTVNEGDTVTITVSTNAPDGTCNYSLSGSTGFSVTDDFDGNVSSTGTVNIINGISQVSFKLKQDLITETKESFTFQLQGCGSNPSTTVVVNDVTPIDYNVKFVDCVTDSVITSPICNNNQLCFNLNTTGIDPGTPINFTVDGLPKFEISFTEDDGTIKSGTFCNYQNMNIKLNSQNYAPGTEVEFTVSGLPAGN